mmetsp:Transcript_1059/g.2294  ORF Transcript_1059/g.2294 Transcript_1059/m.2294 type:complete len:170 (+) Transcript_1059:256-765(+)
MRGELRSECGELMHRKQQSALYCWNNCSTGGPWFWPRRMPPRAIETRVRPLPTIGPFLKRKTRDNISNKPVHNRTSNSTSSSLISSGNNTISNSNKHSNTLSTCNTSTQANKMAITNHKRFHYKSQPNPPHHIHKQHPKNINDQSQQTTRNSQRSRTYLRRPSWRPDTN